MLGQSGLPTTIVRLIAEASAQSNPQKIPEIINNFCLAVVLVSGVLGFIFWIYFGRLIIETFFHDKGIISIIGFLSLLIFLNSIQGVISESFRGMQKFALTSFLGIAPQAFLLLVLASIFIENISISLKTIFTASLLGSVCVFISSIFILRKSFRVSREINFINSFHLLKASGSVLLAQVVIYFLNQADIWVVGHYFSSSQTAIYGIAQKFLALMTMVYTIFIVTMQPFISELYSKGNVEKLSRLIRATTLILLLVNCMIFAGFVLGGRWALGYLYGEYYQAAHLPLVYLSFGHLLAIIFGPAGMVMMMTGHQHLAMKAVIVSALFTMILGLLVRDSFGIEGIAVIWGIGCTFYALINWYLARKIFGINTMAGNFLDIKYFLQEKFNPK